MKSEYIKANIENEDGICVVSRDNEPVSILLLVHTSMGDLGINFNRGQAIKLAEEILGRTGYGAKTGSISLTKKDVISMLRGCYPTHESMNLIPNELYKYNDYHPGERWAQLDSAFNKYSIQELFDLYCKIDKL